MKLEDIRRTLSETHFELSEIVFDEKRGTWGTEVEAALTTAEQDLASALEQISFIVLKREGK